MLEREYLVLYVPCSDSDESEKDVDEDLRLAFKSILRQIFNFVSARWVVESIFAFE